MRGLFAQIAIEGNLSDDVGILRQIKPDQDFILKASFLKIIRNCATHFFHCKKLLVSKSFALFHGSVSTLNPKMAKMSTSMQSISNDQKRDLLIFYCSWPET